MEKCDNVCVNCKDKFIAQAGGYKRHSLSIRLRNTGLTVKEGLALLMSKSFFSTPESVKRPTDFVCSTCYNLLNTAVNGHKAEEEFFARTNEGSYVGNKKRKIVSSTPGKSPKGKRRKVLVDVGTSPFQEKPNAGGIRRRGASFWKNKAKQLLVESRYKAMVLLLYSQSPKAAKDIDEAVGTLVKREVGGFGMCKRLIGKPVTIQNIEEFNWERVLKEFNDHLPLLFHAVTAACSNEKTNDIVKDKKIASRTGIGNMMSTALYIRKPGRYKFLPALHGVELWRSGASQKVFKCFNHLGLTMGVTGTRGTVDRLRTTYDAMILDWKTQIEESFERNKRKTARRSLVFEDDVTGDPSHADEDLPGYVFCWDNVQIESHVRHQTQDKQNKVLLWALSFAVENRVHTTSSESHSSDETVQATSIPLQSFLPTDEDWFFVKERMIVIVKRVLCRNLDFFQHGLDLAVPLHIKHKHSDAMKQKSKIVNLGVLEANPSSTEGVVKVVKNLQMYVPIQPDGTPFPMVCFGDGLSVERMIDAKRCRANGGNRWAQLGGLEPSPQEFHKRMILMQDTFDELFSGRSAADRGTLYHVKNLFNRKNVKKSVKDAFNHDSEFMRFCTEGYVCLFAIYIMSLSVDEEVMLTEEEKMKLLEDLSTDIVERIWNQVPEESVSEVLSAQVTVTNEAKDQEEDITQFCCGEATGVEMVECSNSKCPNGQWFHLDCKDLEEAPSGDWWCTEECRSTDGSIYCTCKKIRLDTEMVRCRNGEDCLRGEWFHKTCIKRGKNPIDSEWFCCSACKMSTIKATVSDGQTDNVYNYSCGVVWMGLSDAIRRDAVREGDGEAMQRFWRLDMTEFWRKNHYKYLILGHRFLAGQNRWLPKRLADDMLHNRTVNLHGREGCNLEMDLVNEFLNNDFKENLKHARGKYTPTHVARTAQIVGTLGKSIDSLYQKEVVGSYIPSATLTRSDASIQKEVTKFVREYEQDKLVEIIPGREHTAFPGYHVDRAIHKPEGLKQRLLGYSIKLDNQKKIKSKI